MSRGWRPGGGALLTAAAAAVFLTIWLPVLIGRQDLIDADLLYQLLPWAGLPGLSHHFNPNLSDTVLQMLPWQWQEATAYAAGELPLWNPSVLNGVPFLAQDQTAAFSPFTIVALLFDPARGMSLAMLLKLWIAGLGTALFLRTLGAGGLGSALAGVAYAGSSYLIIWLGWPHASVAATFPWAFAAGEWYLRSKSRPALPALAVAIAVQFLAGHPETSVHFGLALAAYLLIRALSLGRAALPVLAGLAFAGLVGTALAGAQLLPFLDQLRIAGVSGQRSAAGMGFVHLSRDALLTWLAPNASGNPAIDLRPGPLPNYNEATGFATVTALVLAPIGAFAQWRSRPSVAIALSAVTLVAALTVYGVLSPMAGRLPILDGIDNARLFAVLDFTIPVLAGLGLDALLTSSRDRPELTPFFWVGALAAVASAGFAVILVLKRSRVDHLAPDLHGYIVFWLAFAAVTLLAALCLTAATGVASRRRLAAAGLACLVLGEATIFAAPWNPRTDPQGIPPRSGAMSWLAAHTGDHPIAAVATLVIPESANLYGISDVRGYEVLIDPRKQLYWSRADPGYEYTSYFTLLNHPDARWLARAGVAYVVTPSGDPLPGTNVVDTEEGVSIAEVPGARPFAFAADRVATVGGPEEAASMLSADPAGPVVIETACCPEHGSAAVAVVRRTPDRIELSVAAEAATTVVVEQSYDSGWRATVDGKPARVSPADIDFQALQVPAGRHRVVLVYEPDSFRQGLVVSLLGLVGLFALVVSAFSAAWSSRADRSQR